MADVTPNTANKAKPKPAAAYETQKLEVPKFELPKFDIPNIEVPAAFREFAEKGIAQAKDNYEKFKSVAEEATDVLEGTYANAAKGATDYGLKVIENARINSNASFDLVGQLLTVKSAGEAVELYTSFLRSQFESLTSQAKDLASCAQKAATETVEPIKEGFTSALKKAA